MLGVVGDYLASLTMELLLLDIALIDTLFTSAFLSHPHLAVLRFNARARLGPKSHAGMPFYLTSI